MCKEKKKKEKSLTLSCKLGQVCVIVLQGLKRHDPRVGEQREMVEQVCVCFSINHSCAPGQALCPTFSHNGPHSPLCEAPHTHLHTQYRERDREFGATLNHFGEVKRNAHIYFLILSYFPVTKKNSLTCAFVCVLVFVLFFLKKKKKTTTFCSYIEIHS